jgi:hypothetical protein
MISKLSILMALTGLLIFSACGNELGAPDDEFAADSSLTQMSGESSARLPMGLPDYDNSCAHPGCSSGGHPMGCGVKSDGSCNEGYCTSEVGGARAVTCGRGVTPMMQ